MSTWTSKAAAFAVIMALCGCVIDNGTTAGAAAGTRGIQVAQGAVMVAGPAGFCVDAGASRDGSNGSFVLLGTCAALTGSAFAGQPGQPAILTASVLPGATDSDQLIQSFPDTARFFRSVPGRSALSRSGRPENVEVLDVTSVGNVLYVRLSDNSTWAGQAVEPEYWRAVLALKGNIITLSVLGLRDRPLSAETKRRVLESFVTRMQAANR